jgi:hypothetical protein
LDLSSSNCICMCWGRCFWKFCLCGRLHICRD